MFMITLYPHDIMLVVIGIAIGLALLKIGQGRPILSKIPTLKKEKDKPEDHPLDNDLLRCQYDETEEQMLREGRIETRA